MKKGPNPPAKPSQSTTEEIPNIHWADHVAEDLIAKHPGKSEYVCASGISPSGVVHIGNFREAITVDFVVRALLERNMKVRFLYSWDDYDAFRKVPANLPNQSGLKAELRKPISKVSDPFGIEKSYSAHFEKKFEAEIAQLGINPSFIYQNEPYRRGDYAQGIRDALAHQDKIIEELNRARTEPLPADWTCVSVFCKECDRDTTTVLKYEPPSLFHYRCDTCKEERSTNMEKEGGVKLLWRVDWPMRWAKEGVDFEPGGKDHSSQGGSYETGAGIIRAVWKREPPYYVQYDFVIVKGMGAKLSSSSGNLITLTEALQVYEPAVIRWIFASRKPNIDFSIAFDLDVMKAYDDFDRTERFAYGVEEADEKKIKYERRIYELASVKMRSRDGYGPLPTQFGFRHLCNILQIYQGDLGRTENYFKSVIRNEIERERFRARAKCAWFWITTYAPPEFRFQIRDATESVPLAKNGQAIKDLIEILSKWDSKQGEEELASLLYKIMKEHGLETKIFFQDCYQILIGKPNGPKLAAFLLAMGVEKAVAVLKKAVGEK